jgi:hypothetical protein
MILFEKKIHGFLLVKKKRSSTTGAGVGLKMLMRERVSFLRAAPLTGTDCPRSNITPAKTLPQATRGTLLYSK